MSLLNFPFQILIHLCYFNKLHSSSNAFAELGFEDMWFNNTSVTEVPGNDGQARSPWGALNDPVHPRFFSVRDTRVFPALANSVFMDLAVMLEHILPSFAVHIKAIMFFKHCWDRFGKVHIWVWWSGVYNLFSIYHTRLGVMRKQCKLLPNHCSCTAVQEVCLQESILNCIWLSMSDLEGLVKRQFALITHTCSSIRFRAL